ncbi:MAG: hypothetical protein AABX59_03180 [Nanoarchaeota archaeon]
MAGKKWIWTFLLVFLIIGLVILASTVYVTISEAGEERQVTFLMAFVKWLAQLGGNIKSITVHAINLNWLPNVNGTVNTS